MLKDVFDLWLQYLRSGNYKNCKFRLCNGQRFSPLGVLADLLIKEYGDGRWWNMDQTIGEEAPTIVDKGWAWQFRPKVNNAYMDDLGVQHYRVYLPKGQWFWPSLTTKIQDTIYTWSDTLGYSHDRVSDELERGNHHL